MTIKTKLNKGNPLHIRFLINSNKEYVKEAILAIFNQQTVYEKRHGITLFNNSKGFRVNHAKTGTEYAKMILDKEEFSEEDLENAREMMVHYIKQLVEIHNEEEEIRLMKEKREALMNASTNLLSSKGVDNKHDGVNNLLTPLFFLMSAQGVDMKYSFV